jgi:hypothetical protein
MSTTRIRISGVHGEPVVQISKQNDQCPHAHERPQDCADVDHAGQIRRLSVFGEDIGPTPGTVIPGAHPIEIRPTSNKPGITDRFPVRDE